MVDPAVDRLFKRAGIMLLGAGVLLVPARAPHTAGGFMAGLGDELIFWAQCVFVSFGCLLLLVRLLHRLVPWYGSILLLASGFSVLFAGATGFFGVAKSNLQIAVYITAFAGFIVGLISLVEEWASRPSDDSRS